MNLLLLAVIHVRLRAQISGFFYSAVKSTVSAKKLLFRLVRTRWDWGPEHFHKKVFLCLPLPTYFQMILYLSNKNSDLNRKMLLFRTKKIFSRKERSLPMWKLIQPYSWEQMRIAFRKNPNFFLSYWIASSYFAHNRSLRTLWDTTYNVDTNNVL